MKAELPVLKGTEEVLVDLDLEAVRRQGQAILAEAKEAHTLDHAVALYTTGRGIEDASRAPVDQVLDRIKAMAKVIDQAKKSIAKAMEEASKDLEQGLGMLKGKILAMAKEAIEQEGKDLVRAKLADYGIVLKEEWTYKASGEELDPKFCTSDEYGFRIPDHKAIKAAVTLNKDKTQIKGVQVIRTYNIAYNPRVGG
jgi:hypothetical protein